MKSTLHRIEEIKKSGYRLDLGEAINDIFANYKKIALLSGAVLLLVGLAAVVLFGGFAAVFYGLTEVTSVLTEYREGLFSSTGLIINLVISVIAAGLFAPITAGLIQIAHNAATNEEFDFSTAFMHYKSEYFKEIFFSAAIITLVGSGFTTIFQLLNVYDPLSKMLIFATGLSGLISAFLQLFTILMIPLIIFGNLKAVDAIKGSFVLVFKNFWIILLLVIVCIVFIFLGLIAICVGIIFTIPIMYSLQYCIYKTALPIDETNELDEIGHRF